MKSSTRWDSFDEAWSCYQEYIADKGNKDILTIIDLVFISNFKGGNASITEPAAGLEKKLPAYEKVQTKIRESYSGKSLAQLSEKELTLLVELCNWYIRFATREESKIRGLGPSYASALLSAHFPELVPILDRRVLSGAGIETKRYGNGQVKKIEEYYESLIRYFHRRLKADSSLGGVRALDRVLFVGED